MTTTSDDDNDNDDNDDPLQVTYYDYDYEPSNPDASPVMGGDRGDDVHFCHLRSSYPPNTPAGLRGEAIRSALTTTQRCIGWIREERTVTPTTTTTTKPAGILQIQGRGTIDFLNNKLSQSFGSGSTDDVVFGDDRQNNASNRFYDACLLDAKGRVVDWIQVALIRNDLAYLLTSPGYSSEELLQKLEPFVFPMDEITLTLLRGGGDSSSGSGDPESSCFGFTLASTQYEHVQTVMKNLQDTKTLITNNGEMIFPGSKQTAVWNVMPSSSSSNDQVQVCVIPSVGLPTVACVGYTFLFINHNVGDSGSNNAMTSLGKNVWEHLIAEDNLEGPVELGPLELEALRIEAGQPSCGFEFGPILGQIEDNDQVQKQKKKSSNVINTSPLELHWRNRYIDFDKGCYLGQEGVASVMKNPRGPPRLLYSVVFDDDFNLYDTQTMGDDEEEWENDIIMDGFENLTKSPQPGQKLYALGSNEELLVGTLTSVAEPGATGAAETVGLALIKRADSVLKQMKDLELEISPDQDPMSMFDMSSSGGPASGIVQPPPRDALDGLEVIVEGTFTVGRLKCIPQRRLRRGSSMFDETINIEDIPEWEPRIGRLEIASTTGKAGTVDSTPTTNLSEDLTITDDDAELSEEDLAAQMAKAKEEAEAAAAEAKRKAEKMELLKKRAEEAMARRRKQKTD